MSRKAIEVELEIDTEIAKDVVETMIELGMIRVNEDNDVYYTMMCLNCSKNTDGV